MISLAMNPKKLVFGVELLPEGVTAIKLYVGKIMLNVFIGLMQELSACVTQE